MKRLFLILLVALLKINGLHAQYRTFDGYSIGGSYGFFKSDFGERYDWNTNIANNAYQFNAKLYFNFYKYHWRITSHFRFFATLDFAYGNLKHRGHYAFKSSEIAKRLRTMTAKPILVGLGVGTEFWLQDLTYFSFNKLYGIYRVSPYVGISVLGYYYKPNIQSSLGDINDPAIQPYILHPRFVGHVYNEGGFAPAVNMTLGFSYQITALTHLYLENKFTWFPNDRVDGLDVNDRADKFSDWLYAPIVGLEIILP